MSYFQRFVLICSVAALTFAPAALAGDGGASEPSALEAVLDAILDIFVPTVETAVPEVPEDAPNAGPNIIFIG